MLTFDNLFDYLIHRVKEKGVSILCIETPSGKMHAFINNDLVYFINKIEAFEHLAHAFNIKKIMELIAHTEYCLLKQKIRNVVEDHDLKDYYVQIRIDEQNDLNSVITKKIMSIIDRGDKIIIGTHQRRLVKELLTSSRYTSLNPMKYKSILKSLAEEFFNKSENEENPEFAKIHNLIKNINTSDYTFGY